MTNPLPRLILRAITAAPVVSGILITHVAFAQIHREAIVHEIAGLVANTFRDRGDGVFWEGTVSAPGAFYIRLHFSEVVLPQSDNYTIALRKANGQAIARYDAAQLSRLGSSFYTDPLFADNVRVQVQSKTLPAGLSFRIDRILRHIEASGRLTPQSQVANWLSPAEVRPNTLVHKVAEAVAKVYIGEGFVCTGFLIAPTSLVTNYHCLEKSFSYQSTAANQIGRCDDITFQFDFDRQSSPETSVRTVCRRVLDSEKSLDFAVLALDSGATTKSRKPRAVIALADGSPKEQEDVFVVHHPAGLAKKVSLGCAAFSTGKDMVEHTCSTAGGSSGAPVIREDGTVVALHFAGAFPETMTVGEIDEALAGGRVFRNRSKPIGILRDRLKEFVR